jgi:hypothetical protein
MPSATLRPRHAADAVHDALEDTRVVLVNGYQSCFFRSRSTSTLIRALDAIC